MGKATIHEIAKALNVSSATVSRALNNKDARISEATRKKVRKMANKLGYQPNIMASALRKGSSKVVGIIVPYIDRHFFSSVIRAVEEELKTKGYNLIICQSYDKKENQTEDIKTLLASQVSGIIISPAPETKVADFDRVLEKGIPLILFDRLIKSVPTASVGIDDFQGSYSVTEHVIRQGRTRIALLTRSQKVSVFKERQRGFIAALEDHDIEVNPDYIVPTTGFRENGRDVAKKLMRLKHPPEAICSVSDFAAFGAMEWLLKNDYSVPDDVFVAGFGNDPFTAFITPPMTSVDQKSAQMGKVAAQLFFEQKEAEKVEPRSILLAPELIIRESSIATLVMPDSL